MSRPNVRDDVALMAGYHSPQVEVEVRLNTNEAPEAPPPGFTAQLGDALEDIDWHRYPDRGAVRLREKIAQHDGFDSSQVFAANGSNEVLQSLMLAYGGPGRSALSFEPTYALHSHIARVCGTEVIEVERTDDFLIDVDQAIQTIAARRPTVTFLCSPNNPTGLVEPEATVNAVLEAVSGVDGLLVVDEAYGQFSPTSSLESIDDETPLAVTRTYSKTWSMAAVRLGYLVGPTWLVAELEKVVLPYHLDAMTQAAGIVALDFEREMQARVATITEERGRVEARLAELAVDVWPSGANFVLFRPQTVSGDDAWQQLVDRSILVRNCSSWPRLGDCLRVTIGSPDENSAFLDALADITSAS
jgi:histidinol-phosphate aminotransferase